MRLSTTLLLLIPAATLCGQMPERLTPPDTAEQQALSKTIAEAYKADYDVAKTPPQKVALAKKLIIEAAATKDAPGKFVMFRIARNMAVQQGNLETAFQAIEAMAKSYEVDELQHKLNAVSDASLKTPQAKTAALSPIASLVEESLAEDRHDLAIAAAEKARDLARDARNTVEVKRFTARIKDLEQSRQVFEKVQPALAALEADSEDSEASFAVGWYQCVEKGNWEKGLPNLAKGNNDAIKRLATAELAENPDPQKIADDWWTLGQGHEGMVREKLQAHAATWYRLALKTATGLAKAKMEMRLEGQPDKGIAAIKGEKAGPDATQQAALEWLVAHQSADGGWSFEHTLVCGGKCGNGGSMVDARTAATAMALLAFLSSNETHREGEHKAVVDRGLKHLVSQAIVGRGTAAFNKGSGNMYSHGLATIALCTAYARTKDEKLKAIAQSALTFTVSAQDPRGGGWRYQPGQAGDTSVTGWQVSSFKVGRDAGLKVPDASLKLASIFLDSVASDGGTAYGYTSAGGGGATTASGLLSRTNLGWKDDEPALVRGLKKLSDQGPSPVNLYLDYYASAAMQHADSDLRKKWNDAMLKSLQKSQTADGHAGGSWFITGDHGADTGGRVYSTCMATVIYGMVRE